MLHPDSQSRASGAKRGQFCARVVGQTECVPDRFAGQIGGGPDGSDSQAGRGPHHWSMILELTGRAAGVFRAARPGQFVQIACRDVNDARVAVPLLRRPFSLAGVSVDPAELEPAAGSRSATGGEQGPLYVQVVYRTLGPGTNWLARRGVGDTVDLLGPLGRGFRYPADPAARVLLIGGGVGLPPLFFLADRLAEAGFSQVVGFAAARSGELLPCRLTSGRSAVGDPLEPAQRVEEFSRSGTVAIIVTDNGELGFHGHAVAAVERFLEGRPEWRGAQVYACGPPRMLRAVAELAEREEMPCQVCMEAYMACGMGLCQSCAVAVRAGGQVSDEGGDSAASSGRRYKLVCAHGPVFEGREVLWE